MSTSVKSLLSDGAYITIGMLAGRLLGLLREASIAANFGAGGSADMAITLLLIPDFITSALVAGAIGAALVPAFAVRTTDNALALFWQTLLVCVGAFIILSLSLAPEGNMLGRFLAAGHTMPEDTARAFAITMVSLPLISATWVVIAWLQYRRRLLAPAFATPIFNGVILLMLWFAPGGLTMLSLAIVLGAFLRLLVHLIAFVRSGGYLPPAPMRPWQLRKRLLKHYAAAAGNGLFGMLPQYVPFAIVAAAGAGVAVFNYAFKLVLTPGGMVQTVVQLAILPWFVHMRAEGDLEKQTRAYGMGLQLTWIFCWCACLALTLASQPVASICFGYGRMSAENIATVGELFAVGIWAMPGMALTGVWQQILYAHEHTHGPLIASVIQAILIVPLAWMGQQALGPGGVLVVFNLIQLIPVFLLARHGYRHGILPRLMPSASYFSMSVTSLVVFMPLAWMYHVLALSPLFAFTLAAGIGVLCLLAGLAASSMARQWLLEKIHHT